MATLDPTTARECKGPCLYWCRPKTGPILFVFAVGFLLGMLLMCWWQAGKTEKKNEGDGIYM